MSGRVSKLKRLEERARRIVGLPAAEPVKPNGPRYVPFETLLATDRAVKVVSRKKSRDAVMVVAHLAGDQNADGTSRKFAVGFSNQKSAHAAALSLLITLKEGERELWIKDDRSYNRVITLWAEAARAKIEQKNSVLLEEAEKEARNADPELALVDIRGMSLGDWVKTIFGIKRKGKGKQDDNATE